jgi:hypothetical protein
LTDIKALKSFFTLLTRLGGDSQSSHVGLGVVVDGAESELFANPDGIGISAEKANR